MTTIANTNLTALFDTLRTLAEAFTDKHIYQLLVKLPAGLKPKHGIASRLLFDSKQNRPDQIVVSFHNRYPTRPQGV